MPPMNRPSFLSDDCPPMGIYETLYAFRDSFGQFMGTEGTHPWSQGFPLTTQLEGGPPLPSEVKVTAEDRFYPKAWGHPALREAIAAHYNGFYGSSITPENVMGFAGGRPGILTVLSLLKRDIQVSIGNRSRSPFSPLSFRMILRADLMMLSRRWAVVSCFGAAFFRAVLAKLDLLQFKRCRADAAAR